MPTCKILFFLLLALCTLSGKCDVLYQQVGGEIYMKCGEKLPPNSNVEWQLDNVQIVYINGKTGTTRKGGSHIKDKVRVSDGTLKVPNLETRDSGVYTCVQTGTQYTLHVVSVFAKPGTVLLQSSKAELHCNITGNPAAEVQWLNPTNVQTKGTKQVLPLDSVTSNDHGKWTCLVKDDLKISLKLTVVGLLTEPVEVSEGGEIVLPCSLSQSVSQRVVGGKWEADQHHTDFPTLMNSESKGLHWNGENSTKVKFTSGQLSTNYDVTLINAQRSDEGDYTCTVKFDGELELTAKTNVTVVAKPSGGGTWTKDVFGLQMWIWIAIGGSSVVLVGLVFVIVLVQRRNKRMKKRVKKLRSMRQPLTAKDYCQCNRAETEVELGQRERPLPVHRQQCNPLTNPAGPNHAIDNSYKDY
ncbi:fasciclin-2-like isoform X3 [Siphateles boraxobius]|uniref:fasciclin-2-like isoform X3 n=1 Tax=Siphateles boraxobius TaxID=180520 RepID=UPI004064BFEF